MTTDSSYFKADASDSDRLGLFAYGIGVVLGRLCMGLLVGKF